MLYSGLFAPVDRGVCIGYTMRMRGIFDDPESELYITGLYQNAEAFPLPIGSSRAVQCN